VEVFSATGTFLRQFGTQGSGAGQLLNPAGVGVSPVAPNDVYVADTDNNRVERFTNQGAFVSAFGSNGSAPGQLELPRAIAFDQTGNVYVGDTGFNQRISVFDPAGSFLRLVPGTAFQRLAGLTSSAGPDGGSLYATDGGANTAQRIGYDGLNGTPLQTGVLSAPAGIAVQSTAAGSTNVALVADAGNHRVAIFGGGGPFLGSFGFCCTAQGGGEGSFQDPSGIAYSPFNGRVYVAEGNNCCTKVTVWKSIPDPVLGASMDIQTDSGVVLFKPPGAKKFTNLKKVSLVRSGTIIDARKGTVGITSVTSTGNLQSADFYTGIFKAVQTVKGRGLTDAQLFGGSFKRCPAGASAAKKNPQTVRQLWGSGSGQFRTKGRFAAASIRGTTWLTDDRCDGTLIRVTSGAVTVRDLVTQRTIVVKAGQRYFARATR
jgi:hypothetical protein